MHIFSVLFIRLHLGCLRGLIFLLPFSVFNSFFNNFFGMKFDHTDCPVVHSV